MKTMEPNPLALRPIPLARFETGPAWAIDFRPAETGRLLPMIAMRTNKQQRTYRSPLILESSTSAPIPPHVPGRPVGCPS